MNPGDLRTFGGFTIAGNGRWFFPGTSILLVERFDGILEPKWKILVDGNQEVVDEYTIEHRSHESR